MEGAKGLGLFRGFSKLLLVIGGFGIYFGLHDLLPGLSRLLTRDELRHGIFELIIATFFITGYFFDDLVPKSRSYNLAGAIFAGLIAMMIVLMIWG